MRGPIAPSSQMSLSRGYDALEPQVHDDIGPDPAVQGDHGGDVFEVEGVHRFLRIWPSTTLRAVASPTVDADAARAVPTISVDSAS